LAVAQRVRDIVGTRKSPQQGAPFQRIPRAGGWAPGDLREDVPTNFTPTGKTPRFARPPPANTQAVVSPGRKTVGGTQRRGPGPRILTGAPSGPFGGPPPPGGKISAGRGGHTKATQPKGGPRGGGSVENAHLTETQRRLPPSGSPPSAGIGGGDHPGAWAARDHNFPDGASAGPDSGTRASGKGGSSSGGNGFHDGGPGGRPVWLHVTVFWQTVRELGGGTLGP